MQGTPAPGVPLQSRLTFPLPVATQQQYTSDTAKSCGTVRTTFARICAMCGAILSPPRRHVIHLASAVLVDTQRCANSTIQKIPLNARKKNTLNLRAFLCNPRYPPFAPSLVLIKKTSSSASMHSPSNGVSVMWLRRSQASISESASGLTPMPHGRLRFISRK